MAILAMWAVAQADEPAGCCYEKDACCEPCTFWSEGEYLYVGATGMKMYKGGPGCPDGNPIVCSGWIHSGQPCTVGNKIPNRPHNPTKNRCNESWSQQCPSSPPDS